jgi:hypothetical protein
MRTPVGDGPNNWVQVEKTASGYTASVGRETFDVALIIDTSNGTIVSATMQNPVQAMSRDCTDAALTECGAPRSDPTIREVEMTRVAR